MCINCGMFDIYSLSKWKDKCPAKTAPEYINRKIKTKIKPKW